MKALFTELRMFIAFIFIGWAVKIIPKNKEGLRFLFFMHEYIQEYYIKNKP